MARITRRSACYSGEVRILLADDHPLFRLALAQAVQRVAPEAEIAEVGSFDDALSDLATHADTDLVLLDLHMPGSHGLMALASLRGQFPTISVVMISAHDDAATVQRALVHGAAGFISKRSALDELEAALRAVLNAQTWLPATLRGAVGGGAGNSADRQLAARLAALSPQQMRVLGMVADGLLNKQIADRLGVQERTVKAHLSAVFERLDVRNRTQAGVLLRSLELADPSLHVGD
ncbi:MAG: response regulator transcription factor [Dokdonella sp.]|uniref:response regulator transcription factor n=1 Tax=Dokdonella sp. TaxID=2291710 RepID=UPI0025C5E082|nr:response regulator transcription factor [Dokdonella sp.]MBZ0223623.1 response regulator transcription factor [Dokdonella sp.]MCC7254462.1 response regulator transcription factor [Dokdonella sp.]